MRILVNRRLCLVSALLWSSLAACQADQPNQEKLEPAPAVVAALNANPKLADFVVLAQNSVRLQTGVAVNGGDIGGRGAGSGPFLSGNAAVDVLTGVTVQAARATPAAHGGGR